MRGPFGAPWRGGRCGRSPVYIARSARYDGCVGVASICVSSCSKRTAAVRRRRVRGAFGAFAFVGAFAVAERPAAAVEKQHHLGLDPSFAMLKVADRSSVSAGVELGAHYTYGLSDMFNFMAEGGVALLDAGAARGPEVPRTRPATLARATAGIGYVIDVIRWVPYVGLLAGGYHLAGGTLDGSTLGFGVQLAAGLDYQFSRRWTLGLALRQHEILTNITDYPSYTTVGLKLETTWGF